MAMSRSELIQQKLNMKAHLAELTALTKRPWPVRAEELGSVEKAALLQKGAQARLTQPKEVCKIPFSERRSERFKRFLQRLHDANPSSIYLMTSRTMICGPLLVPSLGDVKFDFDFTVNEGVFAVGTSDLEDGLLLDFSEPRTGERVLEILTQGKNWGKVAY